MRMRPIHGVIVATAVGTAAAFGASAIKDTTHLGAAAQTQSQKDIDRIARARARTLAAQEKALGRARRYRTPALPPVPAAPGPVPPYSDAAPAQPVATAPPAPAGSMTTRHLTPARVVRRSGSIHPNRDAAEVTTTTIGDTPTTTTPAVTTTSRAPLARTTTSTTSRHESDMTTAAPVRETRERRAGEDLRDRDGARRLLRCLGGDRGQALGGLEGVRGGQAAAGARPAAAAAAGGVAGRAQAAAAALVGLQGGAREA
jgi:hypothetical protein